MLNPIIFIVSYNSSRQCFFACIVARRHTTLLVYRFAFNAVICSIHYIVPKFALIIESPLILRLYIVIAVTQQLAPILFICSARFFHDTIRHSRKSTKFV